MKTLSLPLATLLAAACASTMAHADPHAAEVSIGGTLKPMVACTPEASPNRIDFGKISSNRFNTDKATLIGFQSFTLNVNCSGSTKFSVKFTDKKAATLVKDADFLADIRSQLSTAAADNAFGVGSYQEDQATRNIDALFLETRSSGYDITGNVDDASWPRSLDVISTAGAGWVNEPGKVLFKESGTGTAYSFAGYNGNKPLALKSLSMPIKVFVAVDTKQMDIRENIKLDGMFTIEISQL